MWVDNEKYLIPDRFWAFGEKSLWGSPNKSGIKYFELFHEQPTCNFFIPLLGDTFISELFLTAINISKVINWEKALLQIIPSQILPLWVDVHLQTSQRYTCMCLSLISLGSQTTIILNKYNWRNYETIYHLLTCISIQIKRVWPTTLQYQPFFKPITI